MKTVLLIIVTLLTLDAAGQLYVPAGSPTGVINGSTNVGIGTNAPTSKLDVRGQDVQFFSGTATNNLILGRNSAQALNFLVTDTHAYLDYLQDPDENSSHIFYIRNLAQGSSSDNDIRFQSGGVDNLVIKQNNRIGIGTITPSAKLHVLTNSGDNTNGIYVDGGGDANNEYVAYFKGRSSSFPSTVLRLSSNRVSATGYNFIEAIQDEDGTPSTAFLVRGDGSVGVGTNSPAARLHVLESSPLGQTAGDAKLLYRVAGLVNNNFMHNEWLIRTTAGSGWYQAKLHDGISVDQSFLNPGQDTKTWWERDPHNNIQSWGTSSTAYMSLVNGKLGIGTANPNEKLTVNGTIYSTEVKVDLNVPGPDYVFTKDYALPSLEAVQSYINRNQHLPEVPSAKEMEENGVKLGEMNMLLLKKVEELTLYVLELKKEVDLQQQSNNLLRMEVDELKKR